MLCSLILKHDVKHGMVYNAIDSVLRRVTAAYKRLLTGVLHRRSLGVGMWLVFVLMAVPLFLGLKQELAPVEDRGIIFGIVCLTVIGRANLSGSPSSRATI